MSYHGINQIVFLPSFSIEPNKASSFNRVFRRSKYDSLEAQLDLQNETKTPSHTETRSQNTVKRAFHNFQISENAYRTLKRKMNWLYYLAKPKYVKTYSGKEIFNFKMGFITLTLPSSQRHPTAEITKVLFNQFLTEVRQRTKMQNYIWRLEFQKNGNVHYHIATDTYLDYFFIQKLWNRILSNHGYVQPYTAKHSAMSLLEYNHTYNREGKTEFQIIAKRYANGCKTKWTQPPSVDVISVKSAQAIANYIAKYFGKNADGEQLCNELDNEENAANLRLWFCSRSLSKLETVSDFCEAVDYNIFEIVASASRTRKKIYQYATVFYYEIRNLGTHARKFVEQLLRDYSRRQGYIPAI